MAEVTLRLGHAGLASLTVNGMEIAPSVRHIRLVAAEGECAEFEIGISAPLTVEAEAVLRAYAVSPVVEVTSLGDDGPKFIDSTRLDDDH